MFSMSAGPTGARVARSRATASRARSWSITTLSCHAISVNLGGCPPSGGGGRSGRRALRETAPAFLCRGIAGAFLCRGIAGGLGARSPAALGPMDGSIANLTVGCVRLLPAGAGQGNPRPDGSAARRMRASVQMTWPLQSRRTRAGMVDTPNRVTNAFPSLPAAVACGTAVHLGIE